MFLERGKKKTGKGKVVSNAQNSVLRGLGKVMGILFSFSFFFLFFFFFLVKGKKIKEGKYQLVKENAYRKWKIKKEW